jgi:lipopolysaccharide cholinephosphotransferase
MEHKKDTYGEVKRLSNLGKKGWGEIHSNFCVYNGKMNKKAAFEDLMAMKKVLDEEKIIFWLAHGTLLGIIRDNDFIKWDNAVDIHVMEEDFIPKLNIIKEKFMKLNYIFIDAEKELGTKIVMYGYCNKQKCTISSLFLDSRYKKNKYRLQNRIKYCRKFFERYQEIKFKGVSFRVPSPPEKYLDYIYKKWKTPIKSSQPVDRWVHQNIYHQLRKGIYDK